MARDIRGLWRALNFKDTVDGYPTLEPTIRSQYNFYDPQKTIFMPRIGLAYRASEKTVVRSGFGIYYNRTEEETSLQSLGTPPFGITSTGAGDFTGRPQFANPYADINNGFKQSAGGKKPLVISGKDTWTLGDWFENIYLRTAGPQKYSDLFGGKLRLRGDGVQRLKFLLVSLGDLTRALGELLERVALLQQVRVMLAQRLLHGIDL